MIIFEVTTDPFGGVSIVPECLPESVEEFNACMAASLQSWDGTYRLAWLKVPSIKSTLIPHAVAAGFKFHHATDEYLMLTRQLRENAFVPSDASHFIGAGAVVISEDNQLLVIVERYHAKDRPNFYKMPGGLLNATEHLSDAVEREVFEETGVRARFESIVCFRHQHGYRFGKSDFYFVCRLTPLSKEIVMDPEEIAEARWMPVDEYLAGEHISPFNKHIVRMAMQRKGAMHTTIEGYTVDPTKTEIFTVSE